MKNSLVCAAESPRQSRMRLASSACQERLRTATGFTVISGIALGMLLFALHHADLGWVKVKSGNPPVSRPASADPLKGLVQYARDLEMTDVTDGGPTYSLRVESIEFESVPLGFFRVGISQMPVLKGAHLRIDIAPGGTKTSPPEKALEAAFVSLLERQGMALGPLGGLANIEVTPLYIQVNQGGRETLALGSDRASVNLRRRQLDLEGHARLSAYGGARVLETNRLHFSLGTGQVWTDAIVSLRTPLGRSQGERFRGDLSLQTIALGRVLPSMIEIQAAKAMKTVGEKEKEMRP